ncbi:DUF1329 domain-containing protein [Burkholderia sp. Bp8998]|uniref:DUF1329 domain-containing protein n=1 Tax=Burkholderia sp. Bp8998 TaxID=2184557 RepID=UPI000F5AA020|nr:DUF1329 domain-containing protein [Burkholderia sp. Bp8998]RQS06732.1 DUF1329 domain-containing protein [Burkholderia sp. Bp8998]
MKMKKSMFALTALALFSVHSWPVAAADVSKLGDELTATGAEKAGSKDGQIPAFEGQAKPVGSWTYGKPRKDHWKYKDEKPLFVIDASNVDKYADKLTPGQIETLKHVPGYTMPVYPTHRDCGVPEDVAQNTKDGASKSAIGSNGWSLEDAVLPGVPFPVPQNGIQALWNFLVRYQGAGTVYPDILTYLSPRTGSTQSIEYHSEALGYFPWGAKGQHSPKESGGLQSGQYYVYSSPAALAGQGTMARNYFGKDADTFYYFTGQRRVRRLPAYTYDAPMIGYENEYTIDSTGVFNGLPDRFDWKLVGKKEIYIPYNVFAMQNATAKLSDVTGPHFVNPAFRRYELHRVWELVGTVKQGMRHSTPKKVIYLDEDSWIAALGDDYDAQGKIWKAKENYITPQWDLGACNLNAFIQNDLINGRYILDMTIIGTGKDFKNIQDAKSDRRLTEGFFTGESLQAVSSQ